MTAPIKQDARAAAILAVLSKAGPSTVKAVCADTGLAASVIRYRADLLRSHGLITVTRCTPALLSLPSQNVAAEEVNLKFTHVIRPAGTWEKRHVIKKGKPTWFDGLVVGGVPNGEVR